MDEARASQADDRASAAAPGALPTLTYSMYVTKADQVASACLAAQTEPVTDAYVHTKGEDAEAKIEFLEQEVRDGNLPFKTFQAQKEEILQGARRLELIRQQLKE
jgi:hypothetical protein